MSPSFDALFQYQSLRSVVLLADSVRLDGVCWKQPVFYVYYENIRRRHASPKDSKLRVHPD